MVIHEGLMDGVVVERGILHTLDDVDTTIVVKFNSDQNVNELLMTKALSDEASPFKEKLCLPFGHIGHESRPLAIFYKSYDWDLYAFYTWCNHRVRPRCYAHIPEYLNADQPVFLHTELILHVFRSLLEAICILEDHQIIHHDIVPRNIYLSFQPDDEDHPQIVLGDLGVAEVVKNNTSDHDRRHGNISVPEKQHDSTQAVTTKANVYEVGMVVLMLLRSNRSMEALGVDLSQDMTLVKIWLLTCRCIEEDVEKRLSARAAKGMLPLQPLPLISD